MKCYVPGANVKILGKSVHALARIGDELYLESLPDCMIMRTLNFSESAYSMVKFDSNFFSYFNYNFYSTDDNEGLKCKISMRSALNTFKNPKHMDKLIENLEIKLDPKMCKLVFQFKCKDGIVKTYFVPLLDFKSTEAVYLKDLVSNRIMSVQKVFSDALGNFQSSDDQVTLHATVQSLTLRNYIDNTMDHTKIIRAQICLKPAEFISYDIYEEATITFTSKEFKALLAFAEALNLPVQMNFETTGKPIVFIVHNNSTFEAHFVLATEMPDTETQTPHNKSVQRNVSVNINRSKRKDSSKQSSAKKKPHLEMSKHVDKELEIFNFIHEHKENSHRNETYESNNNLEKSKLNTNDSIDYGNEDNIPASPTSKAVIVFKKCFESTFDPRHLQNIVLAENSDSE